MKINPETQEVTFTRVEVAILTNTVYKDYAGDVCRMAVQYMLLPALDLARYDYHTPPNPDDKTPLFK